MSEHVSVLSKYPDYEVNIGMEVHFQLNTKTKIFCSCANRFSEEPNTNICEICTGQPGILPMFNKEVLHSAIKAGLATNCKIAPLSKFDRKHYFYPDLPKNYQITQNDFPLCSNGSISIKLENGDLKHITLNRIHIEEDAGKNIHSGFGGESFVDLNRAGTPLLEIVSTPDISSSYEAREYLKQLRLIMLYLRISTCNMEEGAMRADTNISVRKKGATKLGTRCELKNINSFKFIGDAIEYEIERQIKTLEAGGQIVQETRLWDTKERKSFTMRSKEEAADYRYLREPDLPYIELTQEDIQKVADKLPELPIQKFTRLVEKSNLSPYEAEILINDLDLANYYEGAAKITTSKSLINWVLRDVMGLLKEEKIDIDDFKVTSQKLAELVNLIDSNVINTRTAKDVFLEISKTGKNPKDIIKEQGLEQIGGSEELESIIKNIINNNPEQVAGYKSGKDKLFGFFVGQAMKDTKGKGNAQIINDLLKKYLSE